MDPLASSSRVLRIEQNDDDIDLHDIPQQPRRFNPTPAPITRPPPSSSGNRMTKVQKIKPSNTRKRYKWNDRFHIQTEEEKQFTPPTINNLSHRKKPDKKQAKTYSNIHSTITEKKRSKPKNKPSSSTIPPIDIITGRREWGKRTKKRAKWSIIKNNPETETQRPRRSKWNKSRSTQKFAHDIDIVREEPVNLLSESRSRVLPIKPMLKSSAAPISRSPSPKMKKPIIPKKEMKSRDTKRFKIKESVKKKTKGIRDKDEIAKLFTDVLKDFIENEDKPDMDKLRKYMENKKGKGKENIEQKDENEILNENEENDGNSESLNLAQTLNFKSNKKRAKRKLLPVINRDKNGSIDNEQRKQYLEPLDKFSDNIHRFICE